MEDGKPIIFDDGLREAFEHPLSEWPNLQNAIPADPEKMDSVDVFSYKVATYLSVLRYLFNHNPSIIPLIIKIIKHDYLKNIPDLTSHEIYEIVSHLSLNNSKVLLQQRFDLGVYTRLIDAIQSKDEKGFVKALNGCDLSSIMHILKILHVPTKLYRAIEAWNWNSFKGESVSTEDLYERLRFSLRKSLMDIYGEDSREASRLAKSTVDSLRPIEEDSDLTKIFNRYYSLLYGITCFLKKAELFDESEINVLEYILKSSPLQESYDQSRIYWENGELEERFDEFFGDSDDKGTLSKEKPQPEIRIGKRRKRKRISGRPLLNSDGRTNDSNVENAEIIGDLQPHIDETIPQEPQPEQLSAADSNQTPRQKLTTEQRETIKNFFISPNYFKDTPRDTDDHCTITNEKFKAVNAEARAKKFKAFIKLLAREGCIDPTNEAMQLCAYAFTGIEFKHPFQPGFAKWRQEKVDILLFICTKFYKRNKKSTTNFVKALEVFQVTAEGNRNKRAESVIGTRFDVKFTEAFSDGKTPIRSIFD